MVLRPRQPRDQLLRAAQCSAALAQMKLFQAVWDDVDNPPAR